MGCQALPKEKKIPVIDFSKDDVKRPGTPAWVSSCSAIKQALEEFGCFVLVWGGVSLQLHNKVFQSSEQLFGLPAETKMLNIYDKPYHGYVGHPSIPLHEGLGIDDATSIDAVGSFTRLMWPEGNGQFCENVHSFTKLAAELDRTVTSMIFESYGVEKYHSSCMDSITYLLRFLKYRGPQKDETNMAFIPHTDKSFITILHQNGVDGLQIETRDGDWVSYESPSALSFMVMAGDALMAWSNGRVHSAIHRVVINGVKTRYSLGLFSFSNGEIRVPDELVDEDHPLQYKPFEHYGLLRFYGSEEGRRAEHTVTALKAYSGILN